MNRREVTEGMDRIPLYTPFTPSYIAEMFAGDLHKNRIVSRIVLRGHIPCITRLHEKDDSKSFTRIAVPTPEDQSVCGGCDRLDAGATGCIIFEKALAGENPSIVTRKNVVKYPRWIPVWGAKKST